MVIGGLFIAPETRPAATDALAASLITGLVITPALKAAVGRDRTNAEAGTHSFRPFSSRESFPSGHTITAFAVCTPLIAQYPNAAPGILFCALSVAASRVITGMHFLSDVIVGGVLGWALAEAVMRVF